MRARHKRFGFSSDWMEKWREFFSQSCGVESAKLFLHKFSSAHSLIFIVNKQTDTWIYNLCLAATSESWKFDSLSSYKINGRQFFIRLPCYQNFDNFMTKFMINNRTDTWKTDVNLLIRHSNEYSLTTWLIDPIDLFLAEGIAEYAGNFIYCLISFSCYMQWTPAVPTPFSRRLAVLRIPI